MPGIILFAVEFKEDEPANILLEKIRAEKQKLKKEKKIKKEKNESIIFTRDKSHYEEIKGIERCIDDILYCWVSNIIISIFHNNILFK